MSVADRFISYRDRNGAEARRPFERLFPPPNRLTPAEIAGLRKFLNDQGAAVVIPSAKAKSPEPAAAPANPSPDYDRRGTPPGIVPDCMKSRLALRVLAALGDGPNEGMSTPEIIRAVAAMTGNERLARSGNIHLALRDLVSGGLIVKVREGSQGRGDVNIYRAAFLPYSRRRRPDKGV